MATEGWLNEFTARNSWERLETLFGDPRRPVKLLCGIDQVGTLKVLADVSGRVIKQVDYDSFGMMVHDSLPDLFIPLGFAGGIVDPDTSLVRFGHRDYDPYIGRFTAPDPARDMRGDGDIYDYCVDDPVNGVDPDGLSTREAVPERTFANAVLTGIGNIGPSGKQFAEDLFDAVRHADKTAESLLKTVAGYACQAVGAESEYTAYSQAVTDHFKNRYGNWKDFKETLATDPVGVGVDISMPFSGGGTLAVQGVRAMNRIGRASAAVTRGARVLEKIGAAASAAGAGLDPLTLPSKALGHVAPKVLPPTAVRMAAPIARHNGVIKNTVSAGGTLQSVGKGKKETASGQTQN